MKTYPILKNIFRATLMATVLVAASCSDNNDVDPALGPYEVDTPTNPTPETPTSSDYNEQYRPQIHYTPAKNWINDPNGMVYVNGTYHLFYQYNPQGNSWGNISWGHATSTDLIHWKEEGVALSPDELGMIFSGSCVVDKDNTAGFGAGAIVAMYTSADEYQQQSLAYSTDGGAHFTKYDKNPVIPSTRTDFRDPKMFWYEAGHKWVVELATGNGHTIEIWTSSNLKKWEQASTFSTPLVACNIGQWECPDLFPLDYNGATKWVQIVNTNPGGNAAGSGIMYFIGSFDGTKFTPDEGYDYPLWLDYGADNYAGVTWNNTGDKITYIGWMNNWNYAGAVPASPWRSANTLPRDLKLISYEGKPLLASTVTSNIDQIAGEWKEANQPENTNGGWEVQTTMPTTKDWTITLSNEAGEQYVLTYLSDERIISANRGVNTGETSFSNVFAVPSINMPINTKGNEVTLNLFIDRSSVELLTSNGSAAMTNIVFPKGIYNKVSVSGTDASVKVRTLKRIWDN